MEILLLNDLVMSGMGYYFCERIPRSEYKEILLNNKDNYKSFINCPQSVEIIEELTQIKVEINRKPMSFKEGQRALVLKLKYFKFSKEKDYNYYGKDIGDYEIFKVIFCGEERFNA